MKSSIKCPAVAQADLKMSRTSAFHRWLKRSKNRAERRRANRDPEVQPSYNRYRGWES